MAAWDNDPVVTLDQPKPWENDPVVDAKPKPWEKDPVIGAESPTPASDKALVETPVSPASAFSFKTPQQMDVADQKMIAPYLADVATGVAKGVGDIIPKSVGQAAKMLFYTPIEETPHAIKEAYDVLRGVPIEQAVPESQTYKGFSQKPLTEQAKIVTGQVVPLALGLTGLRESLRPTVGGELNAKPISETAPIHVDVLDTGRPQEGAGQMPAPESGLGVQTRGQGQIVAEPPQETPQPLVRPTPTGPELAAPVPEAGQAPVVSGEKQNLPGLAVPAETTAPALTSPESADVGAVPVTDEPHVSAIANKYTVERINSGDLGPITPGKVSTVQELATLGQKLVNQGADVDAAVSRVMSGTFDPVNDASIVRFEESRLRARKDAAYRGLQADPQNVEKQLAYENAFKDLTDFHQGPIATVKTNWAQAGRGLQGSFPVDLTTADGLREAWLQNTGVDAPESVKPVMEKVANRVRYSIDQENGVKAKLATAIEDAYNKRKAKVTHDQIRDRFMKELEARPCQ